MKGGASMSKGHGVSGHTHTQQQLNAYANQHNPNNPAYWADQENQAKMASESRNDPRLIWPEPDYTNFWDSDSD